MNNLQNAFYLDKLEEVLVANWSQFINSSKLLHYTVNQVQLNKDKLAIVDGLNAGKRINSISITHCHLTNQGFICWVDYNVPIDTKRISEGTLELLLKPDGNIQYLNISGNIYIN